MSDDVSVYGDDDHNFHSAFDLGFDPVALENVKLLVLGHLLFLVGLAFMLLASVEMGSVWITPLLGLPLLLAGRRHRQTARILAFVILIPAIHYAAVWMAVQFEDSRFWLMPGLVGGAVGAVGSFGVMWLLGLLRRDTTTLILLAIGTVVLSGIGGFGLFMSLTSPSGSFASEYLGQLWLYVPWQLFFAYIVAKTLCPAES